MRMVVFDCNVFVQALAGQGSAYRCFELLVQGSDRIVTSEAVLREVRYVLSMPSLQAKLPGITPKRVEALFFHLGRLSLHIDKVPHVFDFPPDPDDEPYLDLALYAGAFALLTRDQEILRLRELSNDLGRSLRARHPSLLLSRPEEYLDLVQAGPNVREILERRRNR